MIVGNRALVYLNVGARGLPATVALSHTAPPINSRHAGRLPLDPGRRYRSPLGQGAIASCSLRVATRADRQGGKIERGKDVQVRVSKKKPPHSLSLFWQLVVVDKKRTLPFPTAESHDRRPGAPRPRRVVIGTSSITQRDLVSPPARPSHSTDQPRHTGLRQEGTGEA